MNHYDSMAEVIIEDLEHFKKEYARKRRTVVENGQEAVYEEKKVEEEEVVFLMDRFAMPRQWMWQLTSEIKRQQMQRINGS